MSNYAFPKMKLDSNGLFGPTGKKHYYKPVVYHNKSAAKDAAKTTWVLKQNEQYEVFRISDESEWVCKKKKGNFSILKNGDVVFGINEERLSFFPTPKNSIDAWHGYPVNSGDYEPSSELVEKWLDDKIIDYRIYIKILKGEL